MNVFDTVRYQARVRPHAVALIEPDRVMSYASVVELVLRFAGGLRRRGIGESDVVALQLGNSTTTLLLRLALARLGAVAVNLPLKLELGEFVELGRSESSREPAAGTGVVLREQTFRLRVAAYKLGTLTLPALSLTALGPGGELLTLQTKPTTVRIGSVLGNEPDPRLKPLDPPVVVYRRSWWLLYTLGALLAAGVVAAASVLAYRRWQARRAARPAAPPVPAHEQALARLAALPVASWLAQQRHKELYAALSEILRAYLGARWGFEALEMTTSEVATALVLRLVPATQRDRAQVLCQACDLVKFAKLQPDDDEARQAFAEVEAIVREMAASAELALQPSVAPATAEEGS